MIFYDLLWSGNPEIGSLSHLLWETYSVYEKLQHIRWKGKIEKPGSLILVKKIFYWFLYLTSPTGFENCSSMKSTLLITRICLQFTTLFKVENWYSAARYLLIFWNILLLISKIIILKTYADFRLWPIFF
jgi:hypothetical protein